ncbi:MAG: ABC transporter permease, partial [Chloroflexi bacterium]|nr:ABC transporter permease [Chloroflexota bacterium]
ESSNVNLVVQGGPAGVVLGRVSVDYFPTLGAIPALGRAFVPGEDQAGADNIAVLSHRFWVERFGGDPTVLGGEVMVAGRSCRIIGALAKDFRPPPMHDADLYQPLVLTIDPARPFGSYLHVIGRLQPGHTAGQVQAETAGLEFPVSASTARALEQREVRVVPLAETLRSRQPMSHAALLAAVAFLYAIACANAANLVLARVHGRRKEFSVRLALGCSRGELVRLALMENLILTLFAGAAGLLMALWI